MRPDRNAEWVGYSAGGVSASAGYGIARVADFDGNRTAWIEGYAAACVSAHSSEIRDFPLFHVERATPPGALGPLPRVWTDAEKTFLQIVRRGPDRLPFHLVERVLQRPESGCRSKASRMRLTAGRGGRSERRAA